MARAIARGLASGSNGHFLPNDMPTPHGAGPLPSYQNRACPIRLRHEAGSVGQGSSCWLVFCVRPHRPARSTGQPKLDPVCGLFSRRCAPDARQRQLKRRVGGVDLPHFGRRQALESTPFERSTTQVFRMAADAHLTEFIKQSDALLAWKGKLDALLSQPDRWGKKHDFTASRPIIERMFQMAEDLSELSLELVDYSFMSTLNQHMEKAASYLAQIDELDTEGIVNNQQSIMSNLNACYGQILTVYKQEVPWLMILGGKLDNWTGQAKQEFQRTRNIRKEAGQHLKEISDAAALARETAGNVGATAFTAGFTNQAKKSLESSRRWLWGAGVAFVLALGATAHFVWLHATESATAPQNAADAIIYMGWRVGTVSLLFWAAIWCGRHFRAHTHNREVNQHRAVCLENMRAFHASVKDQGIKDLVALEFARAATQGMPTGFISGRAETRAESLPNVLPFASGQASTSKG